MPHLKIYYKNKVRPVSWTFLSTQIYKNDKWFIRKSHGRSMDLKTTWQNISQQVLNKSCIIERRIYLVPIILIQNLVLISWSQNTTYPTNLYAFTITNGNLGKNIIAILFWLLLSQRWHDIMAAKIFVKNLLFLIVYQWCNNVL